MPLSILEEHGISGRVMPTAGLPVVYGEWSAGLDANTILSPNENITVKSFFDGIRASVLVLQRFAAMPRSHASRGPQNTVT